MEGRYIPKCESCRSLVRVHCDPVYIVLDSNKTRSSAVEEIPRDDSILEIRIRGRSRSLEIAPMSRAGSSSY